MSLLPSMVMITIDGCCQCMRGRSSNCLEAIIGARISI